MALWAARRLGCLALGLALGACAPVLNWRELRLPDSGGLVASFPCKPEHHRRSLRLPPIEGVLTVHLWSCEADGAQWVLSRTDGLAVEQVPLALRTLAVALRDNTQVAAHHQAGNGAVAAAGLPSVSAIDLGGIAVRGMTPQADARAWRVRVTGGQPSLHWQADAWHFAHGLQVFQATVWRRQAPSNPRDAQSASDAFLRGFHFSP